MTDPDLVLIRLGIAHRNVVGPFGSCARERLDALRTAVAVAKKDAKGNREVLAELARAQKTLADADKRAQKRRRVA